MTGVNKAFTLIFVGLALAGGGFGGGYYFELQKCKLAEKQLDEAKKKATAADEAATKVLAGSRGRTQVLEAALGVVYQNYGMAFDRIVRAQSLAGHMGLTPVVGKDFGELMELLSAQKPEAVNKLLALADKFEATPALTLPKGPPPAAPPVAVPGRPGVAVPAAPIGAPLARPAASGDAGTDHDLVEGREALRQVKELLLAGGETQEMVKKLARAQVLLDDSGVNDLDDELGAAIKAAKSHDEARVRTSIEAALARLRAR